MRILLRTLLMLSLIVWLGGEVFFPFVAATVFGTLRPDTHTAGLIVGQLLTILHDMGFVCGVLGVCALSLASARKIYIPRRILLPCGLLIVMIGLTLYSEFGIIPAMERDRIAVGGNMDAAEIANPARIDFKRLHDRSEQVEGAILLLGLLTVVLLAFAEPVPNPSVPSPSVPSPSVPSPSLPQSLSS